MISKTDLRKQLIEKRKTLNIKELSALVCENIKINPLYINSKNIFAYYPKEYEVDISPLFQNLQKNWFLPKTIGETLAFYEYKYTEQLIEGKFNVKEPKTTVKTNVFPDLIIVPALSVDEKKFRMGYGKGYYDRFLSGFDNSPKTIVPIFSALIVNSLPIEQHDKKVDWVISEKTTF